MTTDKNYTVYVSSTWNPVNLYSVYSGGSLNSAYDYYDERVKDSLDSKHTRVEIICTETTKTCIASRDSVPIDTQKSMPEPKAPTIIKILHSWTGEVLATIEGATLQEADLTGMDLRYAQFKDADLSGAHLAQTDLGNADFTRANLSGACLRDAYLFLADLKDANLKGADLRTASLICANLPGANLEGADLTGADLRRADLRSVNFKDARLKSTILNWTSRRLISEILRQAADSEPDVLLKVEKLEVAALILLQIQPGWCWSSSIKSSTRVHKWAVRVLMKYVQANDDAPELLKEAKAEENLLRKHLGLDWDDAVSTS